ncbi:Uncharacterized protein TCM_033879 [Theobroma cacao]|uniref:Uncharacterized protein n=1 Tax=Theobroma cacao TaxID=3641 RepID=A0A061FJ49_THECC|nr:Uncharacterized protein TCM_033879 [Theobroma cacao]
MVSWVKIFLVQQARLMIPRRHLLSDQVNKTNSKGLQISGRNLNGEKALSPGAESLSPEISSLQLLPMTPNFQTGSSLWESVNPSFSVNIK